MAIAGAIKEFEAVREVSVRISQFGLTCIRAWIYPTPSGYAGQTPRCDLKDAFLAKEIIGVLRFA